MPEPAISVVARGSELFSRFFGDGETGVEGELRSLFAPEPLIVPFRAALEGIEYSGPTALDEFIADSQESWGTLRLQPAEIRPIDEDTVLVVGDLVGTGHETGVETQARVAIVFVVRDGLITELRTYLNERDAMAAGGR